MNIGLWIVAGFLAGSFLMAGAMKLMQGKKVVEKVKRRYWVHSADTWSDAYRQRGPLHLIPGLGPSPNNRYVQGSSQSPEARR